MVGRRQRVGLYTSARLYGGFEGRLGGDTPIMKATFALRAAATQLGNSLALRPKWYDLFPDLEFKMEEIDPLMDRNVILRILGKNDANAKLALMKVTTEDFGGDGGLLEKAMCKAKELGLLAKDGETPTESQQLVAAKLLKLGDKHMRYRAVVNKQLDEQHIR